MSHTSYFTPLNDRAVLAVGGADADKFLQGLVSCDVNKATNTHAAFGALLTPQGKFLFDFFLLRDGETFLLDTEAARAEELLKKLKMYRLRAAVEIVRRETMKVLALVTQTPPLTEAVVRSAGRPENKATEAVVRSAERPENKTVLAVPDPRHPAMGWRLYTEEATLAPGIYHSYGKSLDSLPLQGEGREGVIPSDFTLSPTLSLKGEGAAIPHSSHVQGIPEGSREAYETLRLSLGLPDGSRDAQIDRTFLLENGYDKLGGVDFAKGCYVGQEVTARSRHRGELRKYLFIVKGAAPLPPTGTELMAGEQAVGVMRSSCAGLGLALVRTDRLQEAKMRNLPVLAAGTPVDIIPPWWHTAP